MQDFLLDIGITNRGVNQSDGCYVIDLENSTEYGKINSILDNSDLVTMDEDSYLMTPESEMLQYEGNDNDYLITLLADFLNDDYRLTIKEV